MKKSEGMGCVGSFFIIVVLVSTIVSTCDEQKKTDELEKAARQFMPDDRQHKPLSLEEKQKIIDNALGGDTDAATTRVVVPSTGPSIPVQPQ